MFENYGRCDVRMRFWVIQDQLTNAILVRRGGFLKKTEILLSDEATTYAEAFELAGRYHSTVSKQLSQLAS